MYWRYSFDNSYYHLWEPPTEIVTDFTERYYKGTFELYNMETIYTFNFTFSKEGDFMIKINDNIIFKDKSSGKKDFLIQGRFSSLKEGINTIWIEQHGNSLNRTDFVPHSMRFDHQPDMYIREYDYSPSAIGLPPLSESDVLLMKDNESSTSYRVNAGIPFNFTFLDKNLYSIFTYLVIEPNKCENYPKEIILYGVVEGEIHPEPLHRTTLGCSVHNENRIYLSFESYNRIYTSYMLSVLSTQTCSSAVCNIEIGELRFYMQNRESEEESKVNIAAAITIPLVVVVILIVAIVVWLYYEAEFTTWLPGSKAYKNKKREEEIERMMKEPESTELLSDNNNNNNMSINNNRNIPPPAPPIHHPRREFIEKEYNKKIEEEGFNLTPEERQRQQEKKHKRIIELKRQNLQICSDLLLATSSKLLSISELLEKPNDSQLTILSDFVKLCGVDSSKLMIGNSGGYSWYKLKKLFDEELIESFEKLDPFKVTNPPSLSNLMHINLKDIVDPEINMYELIYNYLRALAEYNASINAKIV